MRRWQVGVHLVLWTRQVKVERRRNIHLGYKLESRVQGGHNLDFNTVSTFLHECLHLLA